MGQPPTKVIRLGRIKASLWKNTTSQGPRHNTTIVRTYKDDEGKWQDTTSFNLDDLLLVAKVADRAHTWICEQIQSKDKGGDSLSPEN